MPEREEPLKFPREYRKDDPVIQKDIPDPVETYIGKDTFATWDGFGIKIDVDRETEVHREIYLEPSCLLALDHFREVLRSRGIRGV